MRGIVNKHLIRVVVHGVEGQGETGHDKKLH